MLADVWASAAETCSASVTPGIGQIWSQPSKLGRHRPSLAEFGESFAELGPSLVGFGKHVGKRLYSERSPELYRRVGLSRAGHQTSQTGRPPGKVVGGRPGGGVRAGLALRTSEHFGTHRRCRANGVVPSGPPGGPLYSLNVCCFLDYSQHFSSQRASAFHPERAATRCVGEAKPYDHTYTYTYT